VKKKIFFAFLVVAIVPAVVTIVAANIFARKELETIRERTATIGLARLDANIVADMAAMGSAAKNEAESEAFRRIFLRKRELGNFFQAQLIGELTNRTDQAQWEFSAIIDTNGVLLARGDFPSMFGDTIDYRTAFGSYSITKPMATATGPLMPVWGSGGIIGIAPITWQEKKLGYIIIGKNFSLDHLREWVGGWAIPSMIVASGQVLNQTQDVPADTLSAESFDEIYMGPNVSSVRLAGRRYLVGRMHLTRPGSGKPPVMILLFFDSAPTDLAVNKLLYSLLGASGLGLLLALIFGAWIARLLTRPLDDIVEASHRISRGDWDADVISFSGGEAGRMADAFNRMIADLRRSRDRVIQAERIGAWRDAARKVAHEIKNPLSPIRVSAEDLLSAYKPNDPAFEPVLKQSVKTISEEVNAIKRFIDEFSSFARTPRPAFAELDVGQLLDDAAALFPAEAKAGRVTAQTESGLKITGDVELLKQALVNLVKNGLEAAPKAKVTVSAVADDDGIILTVDDNGPGFTAKMKDRLFTPFATDKPGGTGLGLVIVQGIVADHGGTISAGENPEGGARFTLHLPLTPPPPPGD